MNIYCMVIMTEVSFTVNSHLYNAIDIGFYQIFQLDIG